MKALKEIRFFKEINELYEATDSRHRAVWDLFDIFRLEDLEGEVAKALPPYCKDFYHISFKKSPSNSSVFINANRFDNKRDCLIFSSPYHIYSWQRSSTTKGFVFYFKEEFLACDILSEFPFFKVTEINLFQPEHAEAEKLLSYFQMIWWSLETPIPTKPILFNRWCWLYFIIANLFTKDIERKKKTNRVVLLS